MPADEGVFPGDGRGKHAREGQEDTRENQRRGVLEPAHGDEERDGPEEDQDPENRDDA